MREGRLSASAPSESFDAFVRASAPRLLRTALLLCRDHHTAENLTQATYAKLFVRWGRVRRASNPVAYARTTLVRTFLSENRRHSSTERPTDDLPEVDAHRTGDLDRRLDLLDALAELSPQDRSVLVLRYWEDLSVAETARLLDLPDTTVRARASRALARMRRRFPDLEDPS